MLITEHTPIANTFGIHCRARYFAEYGSEKELKEILLWHNEKHPTLPLLNVGEGSNLLFTSSDYNGLVLKAANKPDLSFANPMQSCEVTAWAGMKMDDLVQLTIEKGLYGLENLSWIPGTVGASAVQNIGAYGVEAGQHIISVHCIDSTSCEERDFRNGECDYTYRDSIFKHQRQWIVTRVTYVLSTTFKPNLRYGNLASLFVGKTPTAMTVRQAVIEARLGKLPDPNIEGNAGSFFMNPIVSTEKYATLEHKFPNIPHYPAIRGNIKLSAAWLIEQSGWKGRVWGHAAVSEKHALILVNKGNATGQEIVDLCKAIQQSVRERFGVELIPEVNFL